jgi:hypothetical protein
MQNLRDKILNYRHASQHDFSAFLEELYADRDYEPIYPFIELILEELEYVQMEKDEK